MAKRSSSGIPAKGAGSAKMPIRQGGMGPGMSLNAPGATKTAKRWVGGAKPIQRQATK